MKNALLFVTATLSLLTTGAFASSTMEIDFQTENLHPSDTKARVTLVSTNPLCNKLYPNYANGLAIIPREKEGRANVQWFSKNEGRLQVEYSEGGFCQYQLESIDLTFVNGKTYYHSVSFRVSDGKNFQTGYLADYEILKNRRIATAICTLEGKEAFGNCETKFENGKGKSRGFPATFYLWREYLTGNDHIDDVNLVFNYKN